LVASVKGGKGDKRVPVCPRLRGRERNLESMELQQKRQKPRKRN